MNIWIKKHFGKENFDIRLRDFHQHHYAMHGHEEMSMLQTGEFGNTTIFIRLPVKQHKSFYVGFQECAEDDVPAFFKLLGGSESECRALAQKRAASVNLGKNPPHPT